MTGTHSGLRAALGLDSTVFLWRITRFPEAVASYSTCPAAQQAVVGHRKLHDYLTINKDLEREVWWQIQRSKTSADTATGLALSAEDLDQLEAVLTDKRVTVLATLAVNPHLTEDLVDRIITKAAGNASVLRRLSKSPSVSADQLRRILPDLGDWYWLDALANHADYPQDEVATLLLGIPRQRSTRLLTHSSYLDSLLHRREKVAGLLLAGLAASPADWSARLTAVALERVAQSRHFPADGWRLVQEIIGVKPRFSAQRHAVMLALAANPNLDRDGVAWATEWLARVPETSLDHSTLVTQREVTGFRASAGWEPVTGPWENVTAAGQQLTLQALAEAAVSPWHPRVRGDQANGSHSYEDDGVPLTDDVASAMPVQSYRGGPEWYAWRKTLNGVVGFVDSRLRDEPPATWSTLLTLADGWTGTVGELVDVARSV